MTIGDRFLVAWQVVFSVACVVLGVRIVMVVCR